MSGLEILTIGEMYRADALAATRGVPTLVLMENAGWGVARAVMRRWRPRRITVACGPGNNGGDGFVAARLLARSGWPVRLGLLGERDALKGDAREMAGRWRGAIEPLGPELLDGDPLVIDALFGAGLGRPLDGVAAAMVDAINDRRLDCVAVDTPSGVAGDSGAILGRAPRCAATVTFFRPKPGHFLLPGRTFCGAVEVVDIGIPEATLGEIGPRLARNAPSGWLSRLPAPAPDTNKYERGWCAVIAGEMPGASALAAAASRRVGAGMTTVLCEPRLRATFAAFPGLVIRDAASDDDLDPTLRDPRLRAALVGQGGGRGPGSVARTLRALSSGVPLVIDADGLSVFQDDPSALFAAIRSPCVITPHEGEFARLFPTAGDKVARARSAAAKSGAVVLLKGADTVIADPSGACVVADDGPPELATAGSGDVLAGIALGFLAQGAAPFDAACMAAWTHARAARMSRPGLIAEDLVERLPAVLALLQRDVERQKHDAEQKGG